MLHGHIGGEMIVCCLKSSHNVERRVNMFHQRAGEIKAIAVLLLLH